MPVSLVNDPDLPVPGLIRNFRLYKTIDQAYWQYLSFYQTVSRWFGPFQFTCNKPYIFSIVSFCRDCYSKQERHSDHFPCVIVVVVNNDKCAFGAVSQTQRLLGSWNIIQTFTMMYPAHCPWPLLTLTASVTQLDGRPTGDQEVAGSTPAEVGNILSWRFIMKYFLQSFSPFCWFKKGRCQFLAKECAQYWLTAWRTKPAQ